MSFYPEAHAQFAEAVPFGFVEPTCPVISFFPTPILPHAASSTADGVGKSDDLLVGAPLKQGEGCPDQRPQSLL